MSRLTSLDLTTDLEWTQAPMPGASTGIELCRLDSQLGHFTIVARFPAGFERDVAGGYAASEEFLMLDGELEFENRTCRGGDLTVVPGGFLRTRMRSPSGCRVLAWFGAPPRFLKAEELAQHARTLRAGRVGDSALPASEVATWAVGVRPANGGVVEVVTADLTRWKRGELGEIGPRDLVRRDLS